ncbi:MULTISPECIES: DNA-3-methyladenine glycosylase I [Mesorhizobium]|uniref:DNA-3-methyladenine glycosylase I n=1 Tax=Mesorhizobium denitrificans TaxID=2294114 RepID=A0A371XDI8_9HYPH|nr:MULTISPECIES: DNA-3-methyladenine glycosylase I [Mesorhizobium]RFC67291.1 DNA-3-methyladenine glycosylase I [Mesorhizobium denitrificans]
MIDFNKIRERAAKRKGGQEMLGRLLGVAPENGALKDMRDDRILSAMTQRVFSAGFVWSVIEAKWPGFEDAFLGFDVSRLLFEPDDFWGALASDTRIVRNGQKIMSVKENAAFIADIAKEHGSFGKFLANWPADDQIGLMAYLGKRGTRLGGATGQYFLRWIGWDGFIISPDFSAALRDAGLEIAEAPTSKRDLARIQMQLNEWHQQTGLPYRHLSRILSMSIGENRPPEQLLAYIGED